MIETELFTMPEVAAIVGQSYDRIRWAVLARTIDPAWKFGRTRLFTREQVEQLKEHFHERNEE